MFKSIGNNGPLFSGLNQNYINASNSHNPANFSSNQVPTSSRVLPEPLSNVQAAASYIPGCQTGGKINRKKINKISRKYKMSRSRISYLKSRVRSKFMKRGNKRTAKRSNKRTRSNRRSKSQKGGYAQYQNNMPVDNIYSLGGKLSPSLVGMANPPPISNVSNDAIDNLNHNALNSYGKSGAGMGTPSKGWH